MTANSKDQGEWYTVDCGRTQFTLPVQYQDLVHIRMGTVGDMVRARDTKTNKYVAIKKMIRPFETSGHAKRTYRKFTLLMHFNHPDAQVVQLYNVFTPEISLNDFQSLYFVFNYVGYDLHRVIKLNVTFSEEHIKLIIYSLLRGLKFIHSAGILHCDLTPTNIGIEENSNITIFGSARGEANDAYTPYYIETRWWRRAPELILCKKQYDDKLDIWSIGCIMAELILLRPLFLGTFYIDQLDKLFDIIGTPDLAILNDLCTPDTFAYISRLPLKPRKDYNELFGFKYDPVTQTPTSGVSPGGIDFLDHLLSFDHRTRPTAEEAIAHPFLECYHEPMEEPTKESIVDEHQDGVYSIDKWKSIIWQMVEDFVPPTWLNDPVDD